MRASSSFPSRLAPLYLELSFADGTTYRVLVPMKQIRRGIQPFQFSLRTMAGLIFVTAVLLVLVQAPVAQPFVYLAVCTGAVLGGNAAAMRKSLSHTIIFASLGGGLTGCFAGCIF